MLALSELQILLLFEPGVTGEIRIVLGTVLMAVNVNESSSLKAEVILEKMR